MYDAVLGVRSVTEATEFEKGSGITSQIPQIAGELRQQIRQGVYAEPGFPSEAMLTVKYEVSRGTVPDQRPSRQKKCEL